MTIPAQFQDLDWALDLNPQLKTLVAIVYSTKQRYLNYLNNLIGELRRGNCAGIQEKFLDVNANNFQKFPSAIAELKIGQVLIRSGKSVRFLGDDYMRQTPSPDILSTDNTREVYVEVKLLSEDELVEEVLLEGLRNFVQGSNQNVRVDVVLRERLSIPAIGHQERQAKRQVAETTLQEFQTNFTNADLSMLPCQINTNEAEFTIHPSTINRSFVGVMRTAVVMIPENIIKDKLEYDICTKASKRNHWTGNDLLKPYFVAICSDLWPVDEDLIGEVLIGTRTTVFAGLPMPNYEPRPEIETARQRGWEQFLLDEYIIPRDRTYMNWNQRGIYFARNETTNISGTIVRFNDNRYHFAPNPFADDQVNDPALVNYI